MLSACSLAILSISSCFLISGLIIIGTGNATAAFGCCRVFGNSFLLIEGGGDIPAATLPELIKVTGTLLDKLEFGTADAAAGAVADDDDGTTDGKIDADKVLLSPECWKYESIVLFVDAAPREPVSAIIDHEYSSL